MMTKTNNGSNIPKENSLEILNSILDSLKRLGGRATRKEVEAMAGHLLKLTDNQMKYKLKEEYPKTLFLWRLDRTSETLDSMGLLKIPKTNIWELTQSGVSQHSFSVDQIRVAGPSISQLDDVSGGGEYGAAVEDRWRTSLLEKLKSIDWRAFEFFCRDLLRRCGVDDVYTTPAEHDGGIDGHGVIKVGPVGLRLAFECKRWVNEPVGVDVVRSLQGVVNSKNYDRALLMTTSTFSRDAENEAKTGSPKIDLMNGFDLVDKMVELKLGVVERIDIDDDYFKELSLNGQPATN